MPNWGEVREEINELNQQVPLDVVRRKYLSKVYEHTGRNTIAYYSGWLQRDQNNAVSVNDRDISGFMQSIHKLDTSKGLDLILHTPGGSIVATEALVHYLKQKFGNNIRAIVPQLSMSAGTMIALSCKEIIMGKHSSLGPIDPQIGGLPCQAVLEEFDRAQTEVTQDPKRAHLWSLIIGKYHPTFLSSCRNAIALSDDLVKKWLIENMCHGDIARAQNILKHFSSHKTSKTHSRHISAIQCSALGVRIIDLEDDPVLQDLVLTTHHAFMHTFSHSSAIKIIENHRGIAFVENLPRQ